MELEEYDDVKYFINNSRSKPYFSYNKVKFSCYILSILVTLLLFISFIASGVFLIITDIGHSIHQTNCQFETIISGITIILTILVLFIEIFYYIILLFKKISSIKIASTLTIFAIISGILAIYGILINRYIICPFILNTNIILWLSYTSYFLIGKGLVNIGYIVCLYKGII